MAACFNTSLDDLAKEVGGWPDDATVHTIEVIGKGDNPQVLLIGSVPSGERENGSLKFETHSPKFKAVVRLSEYRTAFAKAETRHD